MENSDNIENLDLYNHYMNIAIEQAKKAEEIDEVPIGCVIVYDNQIIGMGYNRRNIEGNVLAHAEIIAINQACQFMKDWRLEDCDLYVTVEPCPMCSGAILQARVKRVIFGTKNKKAGCCGSILNVMNDDRFNHKVEVINGILSDECGKIMSDFFRKKRELAKIEKKNNTIN